MADSTSDSSSNPVALPASGADVHAGGLSVYKPGQGYYTRMGTVVGVSVVSLLGILWLWEYMRAITIEGVNPLYVAAGGAIIVGGLITLLMYYLVFVKARSVDFLIATEGEMKKVNWSTRREVIGSTTAVIVTAMAITVFCYLIDRAFFWFFAQIKVLDV
jgi:preprotein translocase SecE subunit